MTTCIITLTESCVQLTVEYQARLASYHQFLLNEKSLHYLVGIRYWQWWISYSKGPEFSKKIESYLDFFFFNKKTSSWWTNLVIESSLLYFPYKFTSWCNSSFSLSLSPLTKGLHFLIWISVCLIYEVLTLLNSLFNLHETQWNEPW